MRDIRQDLHERLAAAKKNRAGIQSELEELDAEANLLSRLLEMEDARARTGSALKALKIVPVLPIADFFVEVIKERPRTKDELRELAQAKGYFAESDSPGRAVHLTLVNMVRAGRIREREDGKYREAEKKSAPGMTAEGRLESD